MCLLVGALVRALSVQESHAIFYTLVSEGTKEMQYSGKRQQFLVNQGFTYKVVPHTAAAGQVCWPCWLFVDCCCRSNVRAGHQLRWHLCVVRPCCMAALFPWLHKVHGLSRTLAIVLATSPSLQPHASATTRIGPYMQPPTLLVTVVS